MSNTNVPNTETTSQLKDLTDGNPDGYNVGQSATDKIGLYGVTPIIQRAQSAQAVVATTAITPVVTTAATSTGPFGFAEAQANAILAAINSVITRVAANTVLVNELRAALVALGAVKGSA